MLKKRSAPISAPKPASVKRKSPVCIPIWSAIIDEFPVAIFPNGPQCTRAGVPSSVCIKFGFIASFKRTVIAPATSISSAVIGFISLSYPTTIRPILFLKSSSEVHKANAAITSEAAVMSNPVSRGMPSKRPPSPIVVFLNDRSFISITRLHVMLWMSRPRSLP